MKRRAFKWNGALWNTMRDIHFPRVLIFWGSFPFFQWRSVLRTPFWSCIFASAQTNASCRPTCLLVAKNVLSNWVIICQFKQEVDMKTAPFQFSELKDWYWNLPTTFSYVFLLYENNEFSNSTFWLKMAEMETLLQQNNKNTTSLMFIIVVSTKPMIWRPPEQYCVEKPIPPCSARRFQNI